MGKCPFYRAGFIANGNYFWRSVTDPSCKAAGCEDLKRVLTLTDATSEVEPEADADLEPANIESVLVQVDYKTFTAIHDTHFVYRNQ